MKSKLDALTTAKSIMFFRQANPDKARAQPLKNDPIEPTLARSIEPGNLAGILEVSRESRDDDVDSIERAGASLSQNQLPSDFEFQTDELNDIDGLLVDDSILQADLRPLDFSEFQRLVPSPFVTHEAFNVRLLGAQFL